MKLSQVPKEYAAANIGEPIGVAVAGAREIAGRITDLTGVDDVPAMVAHSVERIKSFVDRRLDSVVAGIARNSSRAAEYGAANLNQAEEEIQLRLDRMIGFSQILFGRIASRHEMGKGILMNAEQLSQIARNRSAALRKSSRRLRVLRGRTQAQFHRRIYEIYMQAESELEEEAWQADSIGESAVRQGLETLNETSTNVLRYQAILLETVASGTGHLNALRQQLQSKIPSTRTWADQHVSRAAAYRADRNQAGQGIRGWNDFKHWAESTLAGAQELSDRAALEATERSGIAKGIGYQAVIKAMDYAGSAVKEMATMDRSVRLRGNLQRDGRLLGRANHKSTLDQLDAQRLRLLMEAEQYDRLPSAGGEPMHLHNEMSILQQPTDIALSATASNPPPTLTDLAPENKMPSLGRDPPATNEVLGMEVPNLSDGQEKQRQLPLPSDLTRRPPKKRNSDRKAIPKTTRIDPKREPLAKASLPNLDPSPKPPKAADGPRVALTVDPVICPPAPPSQTLDTSYQTEPPISSVDIAIEGSPPAVLSKEPFELPTSSRASSPGVPKKRHPKAQGALKNPAHFIPKKSESKRAASSPVGPSIPPLSASPPIAPTAPSPPSTASPNRVAKGMNKAPPSRQASTPNLPTPTAAMKPEDEPASSSNSPKQLHQQLLSDDGIGTSPSPAIKNKLAGVMGFDISQARLHTGPAAATAARMMRAEAFTIGRDVFFGANKYDPTSPKGLGLIAHEITHVGQQLGLQGDKIRFATKSGGDDMEQEAQEVGERVANNLVHPTGVRVGSYIRHYVPADDQPLNAGVQARLDRIGLRALNKASRQLAAALVGKNVRLDEIAVDISIDLQALSKEEAIDVWAEAICAAVEAATHKGNVPLGSTTIDAPQVQMYRSEAEVAKLAQSDHQAESEIAAKMAKVMASPSDKALIRKLYVRKELDAQIKRAKKKRGGFSIADFSIFSGVDPDIIKGAFPLKFGDDELFVNSKLAKYGIASGSEYESLEAQLLVMFVAKGIEATLFMLDENERIAQHEYTRYYTTGSYAGPSNDVYELKKAANQLFVLQYNFIESYNAIAKQENLYYRHKNWKEKIPIATMKDMPLMNRVLRPTLLPDHGLAKLTPLWQEWQSTRAELGEKFPILLSNMDLLKITGSDSNADLIHSIVMHVGSILDDIKETKERLSEKKFWELSKMVELTKKNLGVRPSEGADLIITEYMEKKRDDEALWNLLKAAAAIALAVTAMVATGGLAAVAMVGSAALSTYNFAENLDSYTFKSAATNTAVDKAKVISTDHPTLFWLALDLIGAGLDIGAAASAFKNLSKVVKAAEEARATAKAIRADSQAIEDLDSAARKVYRESPNMKLTEDEFVARMFESVRRGMKASESANAQFKVVTELLEGTSKRVIRILAGDEKAVLSMVKEHGNWRGLMNGLMQGGEDGQKLAGEFSKVREALVNDLHAKGFQRLDSASVGPLSDYDLSVKILDGETMGAGAKLIAKENEMALKYGDNWKEAFDINFYTEGRQLLAADEALKLTVSTAQRSARYRRITEVAEELNFAKMVEHAGDDIEALRRVEGYLKSSGAKYDIAHLKKVGEDLRAIGRDQILLDIDEHMEFLKTAKGVAQKAALNEEISRLQMRANYLMNEAYIGPASIKGGHLTTAEAHQVAMSQLEMIEHTIRNNGGDTLKTVRNYEFHKYVSRYVQAAKEAGLSSPKLDHFEVLSRYIYKNVDNRSALNFTGQYGRAAAPNDVIGGVIDANYIQKQFQDFMSEVHSTLPRIREAAISKPNFRYKIHEKINDPAPRPSSPSTPTTPKSGAPPPPPATSPPPATPPPTPADAAAAAPTFTVAETLDDANRLSSAGAAGSGQGANVGVYRTTISGVSHPVVVKTFRPGQAGRMEKELAAAIAAERTGVGTKIYGKVVYDSPLGGKRIGFAMDEVKGGFADAFMGPADAGWTANRLEMLRNAENVTPGTLEDLDKFRQGMFDQGFYYKGDLQGFVDSNGSWRAIDVQGASPISEASSVDEAFLQHQKVFDDMRDLLLRRAKEAKEARAKGIL